MTTDIAKLGLEVDSQGFVRAKGHMEQYKRAAQGAETTSMRLKRQMSSLGSEMTSMGRSLSLRLTAPLVAFAGASAKAFSDFDSAMTKSLAIMGDVSDQLRNEMSMAARQMAKETTFSATQAAESYFFLASAGMDAEQSIAALPAVARFAQAGMFDMARATDLATDAQSALGLAAQDPIENLQNLVRITDVLVGANTLANASVEQFGEALTNKAGAAMRQLNIEVESGVAVLAAWADQGVKGVQAGERFNIVSRDLQTAFRNNREEFERYNIAVFDADENFRNMADIIRDLEDALGDMSVQQQGTTLSLLGFQDRSVAAIRSLLGFSEQIRDYEAALRDAGGITEEVANKQLQTFSAQMALTRSEVQDIFITIGEGLVPVLQSLRDEAGGVIPVFQGWAVAFRDADERTRNLVITVAALVAAVGPLLVILGTLVKSAAALIPIFAALGRGVGPLLPLIGRLTNIKIALGAAAAAAGYKIGTQLNTAILELRRPIEQTEPVMTALQARLDRMERNRTFVTMRENAEAMKLASMSASELETEIARAQRTLRTMERQGAGSSRAAEELRDRILDLERAHADLGEAVEEVVKAEEGRQRVTQTTIREASLFEEMLRGQIDQLRIQKIELEGGTRAVLLYELAQLAAAGASQDHLSVLTQLIDQIDEAEREINKMRRGVEDAVDAIDDATEASTGFDFGLQGLIGTMFEMASGLQGVQDQVSEADALFEKMTDTAERGLNRMSSAFARFITGEIGSFRDFASQINTIMEQTLTDMTQDVLQKAMRGEAIGGGGAFVLGAGLVSAYGARRGGRSGGALSGAAQGAAMGAMFGPYSAVTGGVLGAAAGFFGTSKDPKFQAGGEVGFRHTGGTARERITTDLADVLLRFRGMDAGEQEAVRQGIRGFDRQIAQLIEPMSENFNNAVREALRHQAFDSADHGGIPALLADRFSLVVGQLDEFSRAAVQAEIGLESQVQMLGDLISLRQLAESGAFGDLGFEELGHAMLELRGIGETLGDTVRRVTAAFEDYAQIAADLESAELTAGLNDFQQQLVDIQLWGIESARALRMRAEAAGLESARAEDLARVHEQVAVRIAAVVARMEDQAIGIVESLFGTEATRLQDQIRQLTEAGADESELAPLLERQAEIQRQEEERRRVQQGRELAQLVADIQQTTGDAFSEVAQRLGFDLDELGEVLGVGNDDLVRMLEDLQVDPMALATELDTMTERIVDQLILLPGEFADALARVGEEPSGQIPGDGGPGPGGPGPGGPGPVDPGGNNRPEAIYGPITESTAQTTEAVREVESAIRDGLGEQAASNAQIAAALNNLARAIAEQPGPRSSRTRGEFA